MAESTREFEIGDHTVRVTGGDAPLRPFRGFFSGDELEGEHAHGEPLAGQARGVAAPTRQLPRTWS